MGKIANYNIVNPKGDDKIIISETSGSVKDATKNITVDGIANYTNSKLPENNTIPVPELYIVKKKSTTDDLWGINSKLCIKGFQGDNIKWLQENPTARLFMYTKNQAKAKRTSIAGPYGKSGGWTHPTHLNGAYTQARFGDTNWGNGDTFMYNNQGYNVKFHPIVTEWNVIGDLKVANTGAVADFFDPNLYETTHIEVPFNQLQFLFNYLTPNGTPQTTEYTNFNYPTGLADSPTEQFRVRNGVDNRQSSPGWNTLTPFNFFGDAPQMLKIYFRLVVGIENPNFTLTNHTVPYIFGQPSNPVTLSYQRGITATTNPLNKAVMTVGTSSTISRRNA